MKKHMRTLSPILKYKYIYYICVCVYKHVYLRFTYLLEMQLQRPLHGQPQWLGQDQAEAAWSFRIWVSVEANPWPPPAMLPGASPGSWAASGAAGLKAALLWDAGPVCTGLNHGASMPAWKIPSKKVVYVNFLKKIYVLTVCINVRQKLGCQQSKHKN